LAAPCSTGGSTSRTWSLPTIRSARARRDRGVPRDGGVTKAAGKKRWNRRVARALAQIEPIWNPQWIYLGGGNAKHLTLPLATPHPRDVQRRGLLGGIALWATGRAHEARPNALGSRPSRRADRARLLPVAPMQTTAMLRCKTRSRRSSLPLEQGAPSRGLSAGHPAAQAGCNPRAYLALGNPRLEFEQKAVALGIGALLVIQRALLVDRHAGWPGGTSAGHCPHGVGRRARAGVLELPESALRASK